MASIFLSYARDDLAVAQRVAAALEAAGHTVWWDRHLSAGSRFSKEIDAALRGSDLVVVLWSRSSIESTWVQDEAAFGRDHGRLLPLAIDEVEPPLGFRQFQAQRIARSARKPEVVLAAVAARLGHPAAARQRRARPSLGSGPMWRWAAIGALIMAVLVGLSLLLRADGSGESHAVSVAAAEGGDARRSQELARSVAADLGRFRSGPLGALTILGGKGASGKADYRVEVGVAPAGDKLRADVSLLSAKSSQILWSTTVEGPADRFVDLRQQAVAQLGDVLVCAVDVGSQRRKLGADVLSLYLSGCGQMSDLNASIPDQEVLSVFRQVTERAPDFAPGWANLALVEVNSFPGTPLPDRPALRKAVTAHLAKAQQLGPDLPATIAATATFLPNDAMKSAKALALIDKGLERHPDSALLHDLRAYYLGRIGRMNEAVTAAKRAVALNPLSPTIRDTFISGLAYAGRTDAAFEALKEAEAIWPGSSVLEQARYRLDLRYGDPKAALRLLGRSGGDVRPVPMDTAWKAFLEARIAPNRANIQKALDGFRARYRLDQSDVPGYLQALGTFRRVDEAYEVLRNEVALDSLVYGTEALFRPHMRSIRADPRFIALSAKLGLLQYWEKTGAWPDFCREPQLPYDCRVEAGKLTPEQRHLARFIPGA
jgi:tetratricopeptide (TPR) repeat protein